MGCDIHIVIEQKVNDLEWLGVWSSDIGPRKDGRAPIAQRDYDFFAEAAQVRGTSDSGVYPRNLPIDLSRLAWLQFMSAPTDHHSASHMTVAEFTDAWFRANPESDKARREHAAYDLLGLWTDEGAEYRVVFWFDN